MKSYCPQTKVADFELINPIFGKREIFSPKAKVYPYWQMTNDHISLREIFSGRRKMENIFKILSKEGFTQHDKNLNKNL